MLPSRDVVVVEMLRGYSWDFASTVIIYSVKMKTKRRKICVIYKYVYIPSKGSDTRSCARHQQLPKSLLRIVHGRLLSAIDRTLRSANTCSFRTEVESSVYKSAGLTSSHSPPAICAARNGDILEVFDGQIRCQGPLLAFQSHGV